MYRIVSLLILVIDVIVIIDIVKSNKPSDKKIIWVIAVVLLPVLGPLLYYVLEKRN
jgi:hypothetical protein